MGVAELPHDGAVALRDREIVKFRSSAHRSTVAGSESLVRTVALHAASERRRRVNPRKAYPVDPGLISLFARSGRSYQGHALETVVLLELERRGLEVSYVRTAEGWKVDFYAHRAAEPPLLVQVCLDTGTTRRGNGRYVRSTRPVRSTLMHVSFS